MNSKEKHTTYSYTLLTIEYLVAGSHFLRSISNPGVVSRNTIVLLSEFSRMCEPPSPGATPPASVSASRTVCGIHATNERESGMSQQEAILQVSILRQQCESKDFAIVDLRRQVAELLNYRKQATELKRRLELIDERVQARDTAQEAKITELKARLKLQETLTKQHEARLHKSSEERSTLEQRVAMQLEEAGQRIEEYKEYGSRASAQAQQAANEALHWQQELLDARARLQDAEARLHETVEHLTARVQLAEGRAASAQAAADEALAQAATLKAETTTRAAEAAALGAEVAVLDCRLQVRTRVSYGWMRAREDSRVVY